MLKKVSTFCLLAISAFSTFSFAQNNTSSPYSRFGYGEIADNSSGRSKGMGGTAIGMRSKGSINSVNPASYSSIDSMTFMFEVGASGRQSKFTSDTQSFQTFTGNLDYINFQMPLGKHIALSGGIQPFSFVGYEVTKIDSIKMKTNSGTSSMYNTQTFSGKGTTTEIYGGLSGKITKNLSVGVNLKYVFGELQNSRQIEFDSDNSEIVAAATSLSTTKLTIHDINLRYGLQYYTDLNKNSSLTLGAIFEAKSNLGGKYRIIQSTSSNTPDTISKDNSSDFQTPLTIGLGASYEYNKKLIIGADFLFQNWADTKFFGVTDSLKNRTKLSLGGEYRHNPNSKSYIQRITYRLGANVSSGYWNVNGESPLSYGVSLGFGLPARGSKSLFNLGVEYGRIGKASAKQIQEEYFKFSLSATFNETWFFKRRIE